MSENQLSHQQQPVGQQQENQDLAKSIIAGVKESFQADLKSLQDSIDELRNDCRNDIDDLRVSFNLRERSFKQVVKDGKPMYPRVQKQAPGANQKLTPDKNVSVEITQGVNNAAIDRQGYPLGDPSRNQQQGQSSTQQQQQQQPSSAPIYKRKRWFANEEEISKRESFRSHVVLKFGRRRTHTDAVNAMGKIGRYFNRRVIPTKEPYTDPIGAQLSRKYVLEFMTPDDAKTFREAAQQLKRQEGHQGYSMDAHLTQQQKLVRADIWAEYANYMEHKQLSMDDGKIQLVFFVTNPWIVINNGPRITCQAFREQYASKGNSGNNGFITDTYVNKRIHPSPSTDTLNTIGTAPTPKLIDLLNDLFADPPSNTLHVSNNADPHLNAADTEQHIDLTNVPIEENIDMQTNQKDVQDPNNQFPNTMRNVQPVLLISQQQQAEQDEQFVQQIVSSLADEQQHEQSEDMQVEQVRIEEQQRAVDQGLTQSPRDSAMPQPTTPKSNKDQAAKDKRKTTPLKVQGTFTKPQTDKATVAERKQKNQADRELRKDHKKAHPSVQQDN